jgi:site-specific recombinase XerD
MDVPTAQAVREWLQLNPSEIEAVLAAPDRTTWLGRRDHTLLLLATQTGCKQWDGRSHL